MSDRFLLRGARVLIVDPAFLGDAVFNGPLVRALKRGGAREVGLVVRPPSDAIGEAMPELDEVHVFDKYGRDRGFRGLTRAARKLERAAYDVALIPHPSLRSALLARLARIPTRVGVGRGLRTALFTERHPSIRTEETFVDVRFRMARLGSLGPDARRLAGTLAGAARPDRNSFRVGLVLGSNFATKRWTADNAGILIANLEGKKHKVVLLGTEAERSLYEAVEAAYSGSFLESSEDHLGEDVRSLVNTIAGLDVLVAGDTGPLHIARGLDVPVIALFGPTPADRHAFSPADHVLSTGIECQPCGPHGHERCPLGHHRCMRELSGESVGAAVSKVAASCRGE